MSPASLKSVPFRCGKWTCQATSSALCEQALLWPVSSTESIRNAHHFSSCIHNSTAAKAPAQRAHCWHISYVGSCLSKGRWQTCSCLSCTHGWAYHVRGPLLSTAMYAAKGENSHRHSRGRGSDSDNACRGHSRESPQISMEAGDRFSRL